MWACFSLAAWYSEFSLKSPCPRATPISLLIRTRSTVLSCLSSVLSFFSPEGVMGTLSAMGARFLGHKPHLRTRANLQVGLRWCRAFGKGNPESCRLAFRSPVQDADGAVRADPAPAPDARALGRCRRHRKGSPREDVPNRSFPALRI